MHLAALGGAWLAVVAGFGGMRDHDDGLAFAPRLPAALDRVAFRLRYRGRRLRVEIGPQEATYEILDGEELAVHHHGDWLKLEPGEPVTRPLPPPLTPEPVRQPPGREPARRGRGERVTSLPTNTSRSPDQVASIAATFVSTSPRGDATSRTTSSAAFVGPPEARLGQQTHSIPAGARRAWSVATRLASSRRSVTNNRTMSSGSAGRLSQVMPSSSPSRSGSCGGAAWTCARIPGLKPSFFAAACC